MSGIVEKYVVDQTDSISGYSNSLEIDEENNENLNSNKKAVVTASAFAIAYGLHKSTAPLRIGVTLATVPVLVRFLRAKGFLKVPKN